MVGLKIRKGKFEEGLEDPSRSLPVLAKIAASGMEWVVAIKQVTS